ncbi:MAG: hypothetical protein AB7G21_11670 [Dehalococcoidia bacterium]
MTAPDAPSRIRVIVDADASVPAEVRAALRLAVTPAEPELLLERVPIPRLALERAAFEADVIAQACGAVAEPGEGVVYVRTGDEYGSPPDAVEAARTAVQARGATFRVVDTGAVLMAAGWAAVVAGEAIADGASLDDAAERAGAAAARTRVLAMFEHPEIAGLVEPSLYVSAPRIVASIAGADATAIGSVPKREQGLAALRDQFGAAVRAEAGRPRVAVHHAAAGPAAEAMALWCRRNLEVAEVVIAPVTRHQAARLGPGFLALAWLPEEGAAEA